MFSLKIIGLMWVNELNLNFWGIWVEMVFLAVSQISGSVVLSSRGDCAFTTKAEVAQSGGAAALIVINDQEGQNFI